MSDIINITNTLGPIGTNCYTAANSKTREALIIDPASRGDFLKGIYDNQNLKPVGILLTHGHYDHIGAVNQLKNLYPGIKVYASKDEEGMLADPYKNLAEMFGAAYTTTADEWLRDGDVLELIGTKIRCISTPGHTPGGMCYYLEEEGVLYAGDILFAGSFGRTDFPGGNTRELMLSIRDVLFKLPDDTKVYPGHDSYTTIGREKKDNACLMYFSQI